MSWLRPTREVELHDVTDSWRGAAKEKAKYLLEGIGEQMGEALDIIEIDQSYTPQPVYSNMMMRSAKMDVSADAMPESTVDVQKIKVRYEMKATFRIK